MNSQNRFRSIPKTKSGFSPFNEKVHHSIAFGKIPARRKYELFYERYRSGAELLRANGLGAGRILDIGAGEGNFKFFLDDTWLEWHGIEIWEERAQFCEALGYNIARLNLDKDPFPYESDSFDIVIASHVVEHLSDFDLSLQEMQRVLKPGGLLLVATPVKPPVISSIINYWHRNSSRKTGDTQNSFTAKSLKKAVLSSLAWPESTILDSRGFRIFSSRKILPLEDWKWYYHFSTRLSKRLLWLVPEINIILRKPYTKTGDIHQRI